MVPRHRVGRDRVGGHRAHARPGDHLDAERVGHEGPAGDALGGEGEGEVLRVAGDEGAGEVDLLELDAEVAAGELVGGDVDGPQLGAEVALAQAGDVGVAGGGAGALMLADSPEQVPLVKAAIFANDAKDPAGPVVAEIATISMYFAETHGDRIAARLRCDTVEIPGGHIFGFGFDEAWAEIARRMHAALG